jgi:hypothetical protein
MLVPERVRKSVAFIGYVDGERFVSCGTAFLVSYVTDRHRFTHLVTAQHVIEYIQRTTHEIVVRFNEKRGIHAFGVVPVKHWHFHPDATRFVDVAVAPCGMPDQADMVDLCLDFEAATDEIVKAKGIGPGEEVIIAGYFRYHHGTIRNIPIIRVGNIAAMPEESIQTESGPIQGYLIEARSIGGLSGSPVLVNLPPLRIVDQHVVKTEGPQYYLLGLMHGHYTAKLNTDTNIEEDLDEIKRLNVGIGVVIPVQEILETIMQDELEHERKRIVRDMKKRGKNLTEDVAAGPADAD